MNRNRGGRTRNSKNGQVFHNSPTCLDCCSESRAVQIALVHSPQRRGGISPLRRRSFANRTHPPPNRPHRQRNSLQESNSSSTSSPLSSRALKSMCRMFPVSFHAFPHRTTIHSGALHRRLRIVLCDIHLPQLLQGPLHHQAASTGERIAQERNKRNAWTTGSSSLSILSRSLLIDSRRRS